MAFVVSGDNLTKWGMMEGKGEASVENKFGSKIAFFSKS